MASNTAPGTSPSPENEFQSLKGKTIELEQKDTRKQAISKIEAIMKNVQHDNKAVQQMMFIDDEPEEKPNPILKNPFQKDGNEQQREVKVTNDQMASVDADFATMNIRDQDKKTPPLSETPGQWFENHPWADKTPSNVGIPKIDPIKMHKRYPVSHKWKLHSDKTLLNLKSIANNVDDFLREIQKLDKDNKDKGNRDIKAQTPHFVSKYYAQSLFTSKERTAQTAERNEYKYEVNNEERGTQPIKINIPKSKQKHFKLDGNVCSGPATDELNKRWIFIPSYLRSSCALFDWTNTGIDDENTIRIVVVRPDQYDDYIKYCGHLLPIVSLPEDEEGVGYARYWIQKIATAFGLPYIWMIDDSVKAFYEVHPDDQKGEKIYYNGIRDRKFAEVFQQLEHFAKKDQNPVAAISPARFNRCPPGNNAFTYKPPQGAVYLNISAINKKGIKYRPQLKVFEDMLFGAECVYKGQLSVVRWNRVQLFDIPWKNSGAAVFSSKNKNTKTLNTITVTRKNIDEFFLMEEETDEDDEREDEEEEQQQQQTSKQTSKKTDRKPSKLFCPFEH